MFIVWAAAKRDKRKIERKKKRQRGKNPHSLISMHECAVRVGDMAIRGYTNLDISCFLTTKWQFETSRFWWTVLILLKKEKKILSRIVCNVLLLSFMFIYGRGCALVFTDFNCRLHWVSQSQFGWRFGALFCCFVIDILLLILFSFQNQSEIDVGNAQYKGYVLNSFN